MAPAVKTVGIKDLKNNLSGWLRELKTCHSVLITDRRQVVAQLQEPLSPSDVGVGNSILAAWIRGGKVRGSTPEISVDKPGRSLEPSPIKSEEGTSRRLLDEERGE